MSKKLCRGTSASLGLVGSSSSNTNGFDHNTFNNIRPSQIQWTSSCPRKCSFSNRKSNLLTWKSCCESSRIDVLRPFLSLEDSKMERNHTGSCPSSARGSRLPQPFENYVKICVWENNKFFVIIYEIVLNYNYTFFRKGKLWVPGSTASGHVYSPTGLVWKIFYVYYCVCGAVMGTD